jgi:hypothetical protein
VAKVRLGWGVSCMEDPSLDFAAPEEETPP